MNLLCFSKYSLRVNSPNGWLKVTPGFESLSEDREVPDGSVIVAYDLVAANSMREPFSDVKYTHSAASALEDADGAVFVDY